MTTAWRMWIGVLFGPLLLAGCTLQAVVGEPGSPSVSVTIETPGDMNWVPGTTEVGTRPGMTAPDALLTDLAGRSVALRQVNGRASLVHFWSVSSPASLRAMARLDTLNQAYGNDLAIFAVNAGDPVNRVRQFVQETGYTGRVLLDAQRRSLSLFNVRSVPVSLFLDKRRIVTANLQGELSMDVLDRLARQAMGLD